MTTIALGNHVRRGAFVAALIVLGTSGFAQDAKKSEAKDGQTIDLGGVTITVPESWERGRPSSSMRRAELKVPAARGDKQPGELAVFVFPRGAGTVQANVQRWRQQFKAEDGQAPKVESKKVKGKNVEVTRVEVAGTYVQPPFSGGGTFPGYRLLGAIVETDQGAYFFKLIGPDATIRSAEADFDAMIASMTAEK